jgi:phosphatidylglycerol lysyltransferase
MNIALAVAPMIKPIASQLKARVRTMIAARRQKSAARSLFQEPREQFSVIAAGTEADQFRTLAWASADYRAWLGLCADKQALIDAHGGGILYADRRFHRIALAGPIGKVAHADQLIQEFIAQAHRAHAEPIFYQANAALSAQIQHISGERFRAYKLGEEALISLADFSFEGSARAKLRNFNRKCEREGYYFEVIAQPSDSILAQCRAISEQWLASKHAKEKQFSLGFFDAEYLRQTPIAVVRNGDQVQAFANLLQSADQSVLSVDLMRHSDSAITGVMDYLFGQVMLWAKVQGYANFSLGMSPLKDVERDALARSRLWPVAARKIIKHGERFYNFQGLRRFKEKWQPEWQPRYLLVPKRIDALPALVACTLEIAGR